MPKKILSSISGILVLVGLFLFFSTKAYPQSNLLSPLIEGNFPTPSPRPMENYYFDNLAKRQYEAAKINLMEEYIPPSIHFEPVKNAETWLFTYQSDGKTVSGMANIPNTCSQNRPCPVVIMLRGYAETEIYFTGSGTHKAAGVFAENGFITLAPDFLGFGISDYPDIDVLKTRFTRPITVLNLLSSINQWPIANSEKLFLWGHSNGGQIALSVLEITGENIPTTLWAPVTKGFPDGITYYTGKYEELDENGKKLYNQIKSFCQNFSAERLSIDHYWNKINAPVQIHQGGADTWVPTKWSEDFVNQMQLRGKTVYYHYYPEANHNLKENWDEVVEKDVEFFKKYL